MQPVHGDGDGMSDPDDEKAGSQIVPDGPSRPNAPKPADTPTPEDEEQGRKKTAERGSPRQ